MPLNASGVPPRASRYKAGPSTRCRRRPLRISEPFARAPNALFFIVATALVGALGRRMWDERAGRWSAWVYATTLAPFAAANVLTPDTGLATCVNWSV